MAEILLEGLTQGDEGGVEDCYSCDARYRWSREDLLRQWETRTGYVRGYVTCPCCGLPTSMTLPEEKAG